MANQFWITELLRKNYKPIRLQDSMVLKVNWNASLEMVHSRYKIYLRPKISSSQYIHDNTLN